MTYIKIVHKLMVMFLCLNIISCKNRIKYIDESTICNYKIKGADPLMTRLNVLEDIVLYNKKATQSILLQKGIYRPYIQSLNCKNIMYISDKSIIYTAKNLILKTIFSKREYNGGILISVDSPNKIKDTWFLDHLGPTVLKSVGNVSYEILFISD